MKKPLFALLPLTALMALTGCGGTSEAVAPYKPHVVPTEVKPNTRSEMMFVGESFDIKLLVTPTLASDAKFTFESNLPEVASVNEKGEVKALSAGIATITIVSDEDEDVKTDVKIYVSEKRDDIKTVGTKLTKMNLVQARMGENKEPKKLLTEQVKTYTLLKNGKLFSKSTQYNTILVDKDNAYVYFGGRDTIQHIQDGVTVRDFGAYQFVTDEDYHTYIYHDTDDAKRYCYVATEFNLGTENTRIDTIYSILDSLFSTGRDLVENCVEDALGSDWFNWASLVQSYGYKEDSSGITDLYCVYHQTTSGKATPLMEQNLDIPCYISYDEDDFFKVYWKNGNVKSYLSCFSLTYTYKGVKHKLTIEEKNTFVRDDFTYELPDDSQYTRGEDIFDI